MNQRITPNLDRDWVIAEAFAQLDAGGLHSLSMRRLAGRLGVQAPALYWHFSDKAELLGVMSRDIYATALAAVPALPDWRSWLLAYGRALRDAFAGHRDGALLCATAKPPAYADIDREAVRIAAPLIALGLDRHHALSFQASVISFALGWASFAANGPMRDFLGAMLDFEQSFEAGLAALVCGFRVA